MSIPSLLRRITALWLPAAAIAALLGTCLPASATADPSASGYMVIRSAASGKCLEVYDKATNNGATVDEWTCAGHEANQTWVGGHPNQLWWPNEAFPATPLQSYGMTVPLFQLVNKYSDKCLEVYGWSKSPGARVDQWRCMGTDANQLWYKGTGSSNYDEWVNYHSGLVLAIAGNTKQNGSPSVQASWTGSSSQAWWHIWSAL
jgi:Ricin-type beta-trefoil lectin domain-like